MHILIVEDQKQLAEVVQQALAEEGHVVELAFDGEEGLDLASTGSYDLVVLDWMLPKLTGPQVSRRLREDKVATPILMLTARDSISDRVSGLDAGADDYLVKPFALQELSARIRARSRRKVEPREAKKLAVGELVLDLGARRVWLKDTAIDLTAKEFALLEHLMRNAGQVQSREQIADHVWGYASDVTYNVVDLYIHYLRTKLDREGGKGLIQTVRGVGYSLRSS